MKKLLFATVASLALVAPLAVSSALAQDRQGQQSQQRQHDRETRERADEPRADDGRTQRGNREAWRDDRREVRWDDRVHNGYYADNTWRYGPPPAGYSGRVTLGYHPWARGDQLGYYSSRYTEVNYRAQNLRRPPGGHRWVRDDRGDYLLVSRRRGRIVEVMINDRNYRNGRHAWREDRAEARWDERQHNGYYRDNRWHYGPPAAGRGRGNVTLGYQPWARGQRLGYYNGRYQEVDYRAANLRQPGRGQHWVRDDRGDYLLAAIVGGLIAQVIVNDGR